jgi:hypothetical protein
MLYEPTIVAIILITLSRVSDKTDSECVKKKVITFNIKTITDKAVR